MINICDLHIRQMIPFSYIIRQDCLISHSHIIKDPKNLWVKMILMEVTAKNDHIFLPAVDKGWTESKKYDKICIRNAVVVKFTNARKRKNKHGKERFAIRYRR